MNLRHGRRRGVCLLLLGWVALAPVWLAAAPMLEYDPEHPHAEDPARSLTATALEGTGGSELPPALPQPEASPGGLWRDLDVKWDQLTPLAAILALVGLGAALSRSRWLRLRLVWAMERDHGERRAMSNNDASLLLLALGPGAAAVLWVLGATWVFDEAAWAWSLPALWMGGWLVAVWGASQGCPSCGAWWGRRTAVSHLERSATREEAVPGTFEKLRTHDVQGWHDYRCDTCAHAWRREVRGTVAGPRR